MKNYTVQYWHEIERKWVYIYSYETKDAAVLEAQIRSAVHDNDYRVVMVKSKTVWKSK